MRTKLADDNFEAGADSAKDDDDEGYGDEDESAMIMMQLHNDVTMIRTLIMSAPDGARNLSVPFDCLSSGCWLRVAAGARAGVGVGVCCQPSWCEEKPKHEEANHRGENAVK